MDIKKIILYVVFFLTAINIFSNYFEENMIRYNIDGLYEYFTIGEQEYPFATLVEKEDIVDILNACNESKPSVIKYENNLAVSRILIITSEAMVGSAALLTTYNLFFNNNNAIADTIGFSSLLLGGIIDLIGIGFLQSAKSDIFNAVWEYNLNALTEAGK